MQTKRPRLIHPKHMMTWLRTGFSVTTSLKELGGYSATADVSQQLRESMSLYTDSAGLMLTDHSQLYVPEHENLRFECFKSVHSHPYAGHYGVMRTQRNLNSYISGRSWLRTSSSG